MKKKTILLLCLLSIQYFYSQIGINTPNPKATLDISAKSSSFINNEIDGLLLPRLTGNQIQEMSSSLDLTNQSMMLFATSVPTSNSNVVEKITKAGYYYWDGTKWQSLEGVKENIYTSDGQISASRTIDLNGNNLIFSGNGNVGIGVASPDQKLEIAGTVKTVGVDYNSDERLKSNILSLSKTKEGLNQLRPVSYFWNADGKGKGGSHQLQYGLIAQEVEKIYPNLVNTDQAGYKSVNYTALIPLMIQNIQDLNKGIEELKKQLETLKLDLEKSYKSK